MILFNILYTFRKKNHHHPHKLRFALDNDKLLFIA